MATVLGTSGAWRQVSKRLKSLGVCASHPRELRDQLEWHKVNYDTHVARFAVEVDQEIGALEQRLQQMRAESQSRILTKKTLLEGEIVNIDRQIAQLQSDGGGLRRLLNTAKFQIASMKKKRVELELNKFSDSVYKELAEFQCSVERKKRDRGLLIRQRKQDLDQRICELRAIYTSGELAGANAELEVIDALARLPSDCVVLSDVRLEAEQFMRFGGQPLQSAQIDHAVLTPQGVFVIEVKSWSQEFVQGQLYFDPYEQVSRARFLCQVLLRDHGLACKVRSLIASRGRLPSKQPDQYVKVLAPQELSKYILWFKGPPLTDFEFRGIQKFFEGRICQ